MEPNPAPDSPPVDGNQPQSSQPDSPQPVSDSLPPADPPRPPEIQTPFASLETVMGAAAPAPSAKRRTKGKVIGLIVAAAVLVLLGGAAAAYTYMINKPENILKMALANTFDKQKTKTMHFSGDMTVEEDSSGMSFELSYQGKGSNQTGAFDISAQLDVVLTKLTLDVRSVDAKTLYLKVGGLDGLAELLGAQGSDAAAYAPLITSVNNQWLEINESLLNQVRGDSLKSNTLTDADLQKLKDAYQKHSFLVVKEKLPNAKVKNTDSYHYKVAVDKAQLKQFVTSLKEAKLDSIKPTAKDVEEFNKSIDQADLAKYPFEIWISKDTKQITQLALEVADKEAAVTFRFTIDSYNQPVEVEAPKDAKSLLETLGGFYTDSLPSGETLDFLPAETGTGISL